MRWCTDARLRCESAMVPVSAEVAGCDTKAGNAGADTKNKKSSLFIQKGYHPPGTRSGGNGRLAEGLRPGARLELGGVA
jgi:hypothetical protein